MSKSGKSCSSSKGSKGSYGHGGYGSSDGYGSDDAKAGKESGGGYGGYGYVPESFMAKQVGEDMVEDTEVVSLDHPRVVSQNDVDVIVHTVARAVVSFLAKQVTDHTVENMVLVAVESRVRDRQRAAARVRVARDRVTSDGGDQVMEDTAQPRAIPRQARYLARVTVMDMEDTARIFVGTYGTCVK